ncbi:unnamed protein product, partial [Trichogramma brassicae]
MQSWPCLPTVYVSIIQSSSVCRPESACCERHHIDADTQVTLFIIEVIHIYTLGDFSRGDENVSASSDNFGIDARRPSTRDSPIIERQSTSPGTDLIVKARHCLYKAIVIMNTLLKNYGSDGEDSDESIDNK